MFGPESGNHSNFDGDRIIAHLNPEDPEDAEIIASMEEAKRECLAQFPTIESAVEAYRNGEISRSWIQAGYSSEEIEKYLNSAE